MSKKIIKTDPLYGNYFKAVETKAKLTTESTLEVRKFSNIMMKKNSATNVCHVDKVIFGRDAEIEQRTGLFREVSLAAKALKDKHLFLSNMTKGERAEFFLRL